jgi:hypothetical protein
MAASGNAIDFYASPAEAEHAKTVTLHLMSEARASHSPESAPQQAQAPAQPVFGQAFQPGPEPTLDAVGHGSFSVAPTFEAVQAEVVPAEVLPAEVLPADIVPAVVAADEIVPAEIVVDEIVPADVAPAMDHLGMLTELLAAGILTQEEFDAKKELLTSE